MAPASGIGSLSDMRGGSGHGVASGDTLWLRMPFSFGHSVWLRARGLASGVFVERLVNAGMRDRFGIMQLSGNPGEKRKHCKVNMKGLEARRQQQGGCCFC